MQAEVQAERGVVVSPRNGARADGRATQWKPKQSGNPMGSTAARRFQRSLDHVFDGANKADADTIVRTQVQIASNAENLAAATNAAEWLAKRILGAVPNSAPNVAINANVQLVHQVVFVDRPDEQENPALIEIRAPAQSEQADVDDDGADFEP